MKHGALIQATLITTVILWASAFIGIRIGLDAYTPGSLALLRFLIASGCLGMLYSFLPNRVTIPVKEKIELAMIGIAGIGIYNVCLNYGETSVSAGVASFIIGLIPVFSVMLSVLFLNDRPSLGVWFGIAVSLVGLSVIVASESHSSMISIGVLIILVSAFTGAIQSVFQKKYASRYHAIQITAWILWGGTLSMLYFLPSLYRDLQHASLASTLAICYLGVFPAAIAYLCWSYVLKYMSVNRASLYLYAMPIVSTILGVIFLHEHPSYLSLVGGGLCLLGAIFAHACDRPKTHPI